MNKRNDQIFEAAKQFHEALKALGAQSPSVIYSYTFTDKDDENRIEMGYHGMANDALATCDRIKFNILNDALDRDEDP